MTATLLPGPTTIDAPQPRIPAPPVPGEPRRAAHPPGGTGDPRWVKPAVLALLGATAALYLWGLGASGWANSFYSAAVQAGAKSWKAMFFGSSDAANFITVDKPPAALWVMEISARLFGVNAWSILVPQALEGVAAVGVLYLAVPSLVRCRRRFDRWGDPGPDPRRRLDVSIQQPRRPPRAAAHRRRLRHGAGYRGRSDQMADPRLDPHRLRAS